MRLQAFFDNFELLSDAPNGVQKLRELILQLAVEGKLDTQNSSDEPATVLLEGIKAEKARLIKNKLIKTYIPLPPLSEAEEPSKLPNGWLWQRLDSLCNVITDGTHHTPTYVQAGVPFLSVKDISGGKINLTNTRFISVEEHQELIKRCNPEFEDILFTKVGTTGIAKVIDVEVEFSIFVSVALLKFSKKFLSPYYLELLLNSPFVKAQSARDTQGIGNKNLVLRFIKNFIVPLPPLEEQKRIVAKVDELMRLCNEFKARQQARRESRRCLNNATLAPLNDAASLAPEEFEQALSHLASNFDVLYDSAETVAKLRSTILQLAVQGKLVPQDPHDESGSTLLKKIRKEIIDENKKVDQIIPIKSSELKFQLPLGWSAARIGELFFISSGTTPSRAKREYFTDGTENWVKTTDLSNGVVTACEEKITLQAVKDCNLKYYPIGTICIAMYGGGGTIGKSGILGFETTINQSVCGITPSNYYLPEFLHLYVKSIRNDWMKFAAGLRKDPNINAKIIRSMVLAIPPLKEQKRIVAKVNQLMALCDELETKLRQTEADSEKLMKAAVRDLLASITIEQPSIGQDKSLSETAMALSST